MMKSSFKKMAVFFLVFSIAFVFFNFKKRNNSTVKPAPVKTAVALCCSASIPNRFGVKTNALAEKELNHASLTTGNKVQSMVWINGGTYLMGADNKQASADEYPKHKVKVKGFYIDVTEVTNAEFGSFVKATKYVTTAERKPDWDQLKKQLPPNTPKPDEDLLVAASLVFKPAKRKVDLNNYAEWWTWTKGADWKHPHGPGSNIKDKQNHPVVHVSFEDALAYCKWAGKRLPTEAEWVWAARGGLTNKIYPWGNEAINTGKVKANSWEGEFPYKNLQKDGYYFTAPVKSFAANGYGLYDVAGNVWEWCADYYDGRYYAGFKKDQTADNPKGPSKSYDPDDIYAIKRSIRGGSFLCNDSYCSGYRVSRRMKTSEDSSLEHLGFRCVKDK